MEKYMEKTVSHSEIPFFTIAFPYYWIILQQIRTNNLIKNDDKFFRNLRQTR